MNFKRFPRGGSSERGEDFMSEFETKRASNLACPDFAHDSSPRPTICPWVSEDETSRHQKIIFFISFHVSGVVFKITGCCSPLLSSFLYFFCSRFKLCAAKAQGLGERLLHKLHTEAYLYPSFSKKILY